MLQAFLNQKNIPQQTHIEIRPETLSESYRQAYVPTIAKSSLCTVPVPLVTQSENVGHLPAPFQLEVHNQILGLHVSVSMGGGRLFDGVSRAFDMIAVSAQKAIEGGSELGRQWMEAKRANIARAEAAHAASSAALPQTPASTAQKSTEAQEDEDDDEQPRVIH